MAKFKVELTYKDLEKDNILNVGDEVEMTVKRADEVNEKLAQYGTVLTRLDAPQKQKKAKVEVKEETVDKEETVEE